jgi:hypothetical protein
MSLNTAALCQIRDLGPVLAWVRMKTECNTVAAAGKTRARAGVVDRAMHGRVRM